VVVSSSSIEMTTRKRSLRHG